jgi:hypothetical protein
MRQFNEIMRFTNETDFKQMVWIVTTLILGPFKHKHTTKTIKHNKN